MKRILFLTFVLIFSGCVKEPEEFVSSFITEEGKTYGPVEVPDGSDSPLLDKAEFNSLTGIHYILDPDNRLWKASSFENGQKDGFSIVWHLNGKVRSQRFYRKGELSGETLFFYPDGTLKSEINYESGLRNGQFKEYFPNGSIKKKGQFNDDEPIGEWLIYNETGEVVNREIH